MERESRTVGADQGQWDSLAARWERHGPPLRPGPLDVALYQRAVDQLGQRPGVPALILGVTPEIYRLRWPEGTELRALDRSREMIDTVWPGRPEQAIEGEWGAPNFEPGSFDIVLCDGGLHLLDYPAGQSELVQQLARIVIPGGQVVFRLFLPPERREDPEQVIADLAAGQIRDMNCLKIRLMQAMTSSPVEGVMLDDVWQFLHTRIGDRESFFANLGWDSHRVAVIDLYRGSQARYHFADLDSVKALFGTDRATPFRRIDVTAPAHMMGDRCRHLRLERV